MSLLHVTCLLVLLYIPTKYYQSMSKGIKVMECTRMRLQYFCFRGDNYITKWELSLLHGTHLLVLLFIPTKYYQIISNSMGVMTCTRFWLQGRQLHNKDRESCLSCMRRAYWSSSTLLPNVIKIFPRVSKLWSAQGCISGHGRKDSRMDGQTDGRHADCYIPRTYRLGDKN